MPPPRLRVFGANDWLHSHRHDGKGSKAKRPEEEGNYASDRNTRKDRQQREWSESRSDHTAWAQGCGSGYACTESIVSCRQKTPRGCRARCYCDSLPVQATHILPTRQSQARGSGRRFPGFNDSITYPEFTRLRRSRLSSCHFAPCPWLFTANCTTTQPFSLTHGDGILSA
jgi:hypothetical protein